AWVSVLEGHGSLHEELEKKSPREPLRPVCRASAEEHKAPNTVVVVVFSRLDATRSDVLGDLKPMRTNRLRCRIATLAGCAAALVATGVLTVACATSEKQAPSTTSTTTSTTSSSTPPSTEAPPPTTEKSLDPNGGNLFSPQVKAPPAPTEPPGV